MLSQIHFIIPKVPPANCHTVNTRPLPSGCLEAFAILLSHIGFDFALLALPPLPSLKHQEIGRHLQDFSGCKLRCPSSAPNPEFQTATNGQAHQPGVGPGEEAGDDGERGGGREEPHRGLGGLRGRPPNGRLPAVALK